MKTQPKTLNERGFALVVTLSLMILLTIIAVGLLTLSSVSLRSTSQGEAMATARANARLALLQAIGELQRTAGPDQRVTAPANLVDDSNPMGITGVWQSWKPDRNGVSESDYTQRRSGDYFLGYLISNPNAASATPDPSAIPTAAAGQNLSEKLVSTGSLGTNVDGREIEAPIVLTRSPRDSKAQGGYAWAVMDEGIKGRIDLEPAPEASALGEQIARVGAPARNGFANINGLSFLESTDEDDLRKELPKLVSINQVSLLPSSSTNTISNYFHDFTVSSASLQTNVADGGLKTDLSVAFDGEFKSSLSGDFESNYLYSNDSDPHLSTNSDPLWSLFANYSRLYRVNGIGSAGLNAALPSNYRLKRVRDTSSSPAIYRYEPEMKQIAEPFLMPTVVRVDVMFSLVVRDAHAGRGSSAYPHMLHLMYLPVITLHNPYNVPLSCNGLEVEFSDVPIGFQFLINGNPANTGGLVPLNNLYINASGAKKTFSVKLSNDLNRQQAVNMGPGETRIFGTPFLPTSSWNSEMQSNGQIMFDWRSDLTGASGSSVLIKPGMITGPADGIGFDIDWLVPNSRSPYLKSRRDDGVIVLNDTDKIQVKFGPTVPPTAGNVFSITTKMNGADLGSTQVAYKNLTTLTRILEEGVSERFPEERDFPATFPPQGQAPLAARTLHESGETKFRDYAAAVPFAVFSVGAKTTVESFTQSRPMTDTGMAFQMATCDFRRSTSQGTNPMEFALVPVQNGGAAMESGGPNSDMAFFFGGNGSTNGSCSATIYEIPMAPLQSIAQLRNANGASLGTVPYVTYSVGESRAHPAIPSESASFEMGSSTLLDHSWLANSTLWDGYWFSTLSSLQGPAYSGSAAMDQSELATQFFDGTSLLPNPRNTPYVPAGKPPNTAATDAIAGNGKNTAAYIMTEGCFNVNSTSVSAWTALLSALAKSDIPLASGGSELSTGAPFPRFRRPVRGANDNSIDPKEKLWNSYRTLEAAQVKTLAERIVDEVRERGPFLSMADFVNRRLGSSSDLTLKGALQAALDKANVNTAMEANARPIDTAEVNKYGWQNPDAIAANTGTGAPGEITQGDILSAIGSFITVRSDTFRIRCYGDARDANGKVIAKTWCEATVQRFPEYLDPTDAPEAAASTDTNQLFGRQFRVVAFRWLSSKEI